MPRQVLETWMKAISDMIAYQAKRFAIGAWTLLVIAVMIGFYKVNNLSHANSNRIADIQQSRVDSCKKNYKSFREVLQPFFRPASEQTKKEKADQKKFNVIIDSKIKSCVKQTKPR